MESARAGQSFELDDIHGEIVAGWRPRELATELRRLMDPATADETIHWGRNYLYRSHLETPVGRLAVVVKQFRNQGWLRNLERRIRGSKAERSWRNARAFQAAGLATAEPVALIESKRPDGPSFFVTRHLADVLEARYLLRAANQGTLAESFPGLDFESFLDALGQALRRMHEAGFFHRDLSIGNVLLPSGRGRFAATDLYLIDLNRARHRQSPSLSQRTRDLCRLTIHRPEHQRRFLAAYWGAARARGLRTAIYLAYHHGFRLKIASKKAIREPVRGLRQWVLPRRAHAHIPAAPSEASARDKIVWDDLSDQPHQHAGRAEKLLVRLTDAPSHLRQMGVFFGAAPRIARRYRRLKQDLYRGPIPWGGLGIGLRPYPPAPEQLLAAVEDLGARQVLLRLHPWQERHDDEEELARELDRRGFELAFALPQNRDLVRRPALWRQRIEELAERFTPYGRHFQVGQAINRSKWGVWRFSEYLELAASAAEILRRYPGVEVLGPAVIDFEPYATTAVLNLRTEAHFDIVSSLLYVDRRGAPENPQLGFDTVDKIVLLKAIAETARNSGPRSWITEVNWPLWEGPHSPAGRTVSVDEETQADYLTRYLLLALTSGAVERVYWWQLLARGYGLLAPLESRRLRRRPAFHAFATLSRTLRQAQLLRPLPSPRGTRIFLFRCRDGKECAVGWSLEERRFATLPRAPEAIFERDGEHARAAGSPEVELTPSIRYFHI